jgi:type II secretory pathway pseudopilin PulG
VGYLTAFTNSPMLQELTSMRMIAACGQSPLRSVRAKTIRGGITLIELLVVISIIGLLCGILLPAVQTVRESGRRAQCQNNLRNQVLALQCSHDLFLALPSAKKKVNGLETSWYLTIMPQLEQASLQTNYDYNAPFSDAKQNLQITTTILPILRCPSSVRKYVGDCDYGGMSGSLLTAQSWENAFLNGVIITPEEKLGRPIDLSCITDGTSQTIAIAENADRIAPHGLWIHPENAFSHDNGGINSQGPGEIYSLHKSGSFVAFMDGSTRYLSVNTAPEIVGALCTRDFGEIVNSQSF